MKSKLYRRSALKEFFKAGRRPSEEHFESLIDSMLNKMDDGISKNSSEGLMLAKPDPQESQLIAFKKNIQDPYAQWGVHLEAEPKSGLRIQQGDPNVANPTLLYFQKGGQIGVNTETPRTHLEINGVLGTKSRMGTAIITTVPADGKWHDVVSGLNGYSAYEVMAQVGKEKSGRHALLHATAVSTFGRSRSRIRRTQAYYGWWWNRISLRWKGTTFNYGLQVRTRSNYGNDVKIRLCATQLWDDAMMEFIDKQ